MKNNKIGLVFSGGGGKGAYEIGVWKALEEFGVAENISVVSGTSVGALNAALFAQGCYQTAEDAWLSITPSDILHINIEQIIKLLISLGLPGPKVAKLAGLLKAGIFSRAGLSRIIDSYLDEGLVQRKGRTAFAHCTRVPFVGHTFPFCGESKERMKAILLASSAIPGVFGAQRIDGHSYIDGFFTSNTPIAPVYKAGCDIIINVFLGRIGGFFDDCYVSHKAYPDAVIVDIVPRIDPGGLFTGVLNFNNIPEKIERGYRDAKRILEPVWEMHRAQFRRGELLALTQQQEREWAQISNRIAAANVDMAQGMTALQDEMRKW